MSFLDNFTNPFTAPGPGGTAFRDGLIAVGTIIGTMGTIGLVDPEKATDWNNVIAVTIAQWPAISAAAGALMVVVTSIYRATFKSRTVVGEEAGKQAEKIEAGEKKDAVVQTPEGKPDIVVVAQTVAAVKEAVDRFKK